VRREQDGTWDPLLTQAQTRADADGTVVWALGVDSTIVLAHQHAAGARKKGAPLTRTTRRSDAAGAG